MSKDTFKISFEVVKPMPVKEISNWEDKVVYGIARATLDFTNSSHHFPYLTGELNRASMNEGVVQETKGTYHLGARGVEYAPKVWNYGQNTNWTNKQTLPKWYVSVYNKYRDTINEAALKNAESELK